MSRPIRVILPIVIVVIAVAAAYGLYASRPKAEPQAPEPVLPVVRTHAVALESLQMSVRSQGTVVPRTESALVSEVAGRVVEVSPSFAPGGFFEAGEWLLKIDTHDYRQRLVQAQASESQARLRLAQIEAEAALARREWEALGEGEPTALTLFEPQLAEAQATLEAALAGVAQAQRNLDRTTIVAPYAGRVRAKQADLGQVVAPGTPLASIYAVDYAEVRLPLPDDQLAYVDLPFGYRGEAAKRGPKTTLRAEFAGTTHEWEGRIVRTEGVIDPQSRMVHTVARVKNPYGRGDGSRPPLAAGLFVEAEIVGKTVDNVAVIPRRALRPDGRILIVDGENKLRYREIDVLRADQESLIVQAGLNDGDRVCLSALSAVVDGMPVRLQEGDS